MHWCGIDIAKRKHMVAVLDADGQVAQVPFSIANTRAGFERLRQTLSTLSGPVQIGLEATGHYWLALPSPGWTGYDDLTRHDYPVVVFNPLQIHAYRKSGLRKLKHDRSDAIWTADFSRTQYSVQCSRHCAERTGSVSASGRRRSNPCLNISNCAS